MIAFVFTKKVVGIDELFSFDSKHFSYSEGINGLNRVKRECEACGSGPLYKYYGTKVRTSLFILPVAQMYEQHSLVCTECGNAISLENSESNGLNRLIKKYEEAVGETK